MIHPALFTSGAPDPSGSAMYFLGQICPEQAVREGICLGSTHTLQHVVLIGKFNFTFQQSTGWWLVVYFCFLIFFELHLA
jgi:hypothetical protein